MRAEEIQALQRLGLNELVERALEIGIPITHLSTPDVDGRRLLLTPDGVRLRIIDRTVEQELTEQQATREIPTQEVEHGGSDG